MNIRIAKAAPFSGAPTVTAPSVLGATTGKPFLYRIPALGARPMTYDITGLPEGVTLNGAVLSGVIRQDGQWQLTIRAANKEGVCERSVRLTAAGDNALRTPLLGFTTWNAFAHDVRQKDIERTARQLIGMGIAEYGYSYVNLDSGWQKEYGGPFDAIQPNEKFPDMKGMYDSLHALGLRGGIYSTPMLTAWGCPPEYASIPGCTRGEPDPLRTCANGGVGLEHLEENNVRQWEEWGVDYLKYDWTPTDPWTADPMKQALLSAGRDIPMCVTVHANICYGKYWKKNCCSWRDNHDSIDQWNIFLMIVDSIDQPWQDYVCPGHFFDLDMLEIGDMFWNKGKRGLTEAEYVSCYSLRAFFASPIQLSCRLENLTEFEFSLICNEEIIAVNQDALAAWPRTLRKDEAVRIYARPLENGDTAYALFNLTNEERTETISLPENTAVRDLWEKENLPPASNLVCTLAPHGARIFRASPA